MRVAIRWSIAITSTLAAFGLTIWLSALAGADEGWALTLGGLTATLALAVLQHWATRRSDASAKNEPAPTGTGTDSQGGSTGAGISQNTIADSAKIGGSAIQTGDVQGGIHIYQPPSNVREQPPINATPPSPIRVGDVPQRPAAFQPRTDLFERIAAAERVAIVQALTGARGVGKTQLAAEYARRCIADGWQLVAWIPAEEPGQALAGLAELAEELGLRYAGEDASSAVRKVRRWLESAAPEDCLLVFDNAVGIEGLRQWLPATGSARIIITSNDHAFEDLGVAINVDVFTPAEAEAYPADQDPTWRCRRSETTCR
jgi:hypothetical protein